jgi:hypothetical protein
MFAAQGISVATFSTADENGMKKRFFNETTTRPGESAWIDLGLSCVHIVNPFSFFVGTAGFNEHARLVLQH